MSGTSPAVDSLGDPVPPPPESASNDPRDIAAGVPREASLAAVLARAEADQAQDGAAAPAEGATGPTPTEQPAEGASGASGPAEGASGATGAEPTGDDAETVDELLKRDNTPLWMKKTITKERNKAREAAAEAERTRAELAATQKRIDEALAKIAELTPPPAPPKPATPRPTRDQFASPEAYDAAVEAWGEATAKAAADQALADAQAKQKAEADAKEAREAEARQQTELKALQDGFAARRATALTKYQDYEAVAEADTTRVEVPSAIAIMQAENGPDILYHLGKNPAEAQRIAALTPQQQVFEIGRLSATLAQPARPVVSKAPAPLRPIQATREQATDANREETMDEVAARVRKRDSAGRVGMWGRSAETAH